MMVKWNLLNLNGILRAMRIKSKFHDYYDCMQANYAPHPFYLREQKYIYPNERGYLGVGYTNSYNPTDIYQYRNVIGFCGKVYPFVEFNYINYSEGISKTYFCYSVEDISNMVEQIANKDQLAYYSAGNNDNWRKARQLKWPRNLTVKHTKFNFVYQNTGNQIGKDLIPLFERFKAPIFLSSSKPRDGEDKPYLLLNPCLKDYEFYRIFDTYRAFQELEMYLGNLAAPEKPIPAVSDKDMIMAKGFDKFSFRKDKSK